RNDRVERGIEPFDLDVDFLGCNRERAASAGMKFQLGVVQEDEVRGRLRDRPVDAEDCQLDLLTGLYIAPDNQAILGVPALHHGAAALPGWMWQLAVDPDLGVVVDLSFEYERGASGRETAHTLGHREANAVPVEAQMTVATRLCQGGGIDCLPSAVIEIARAGPRREVIRLILRAGWLTIAAGVVKRNRDDARVAVAPLRTHQRDPFARAEIDRRLRCIGERIVLGVRGGAGDRQGNADRGRRKG